MKAKQAAVMQELMATVFTCVELNLYLDTHPWDEEALAYFNEQAERLMMLKDEYEALYGPLLGFGYSLNPGSAWNWIDSPWPWEMSGEE